MLYPVAYDGYPQPSTAEQSVLTVDSGARVEFLVRFDTPGTYTMRRLPWNYGLSGVELCERNFGIAAEACVSWDQERVIATIVVEDNPNAGAAPAFPATLPGLAPQLTAMAEQMSVRERNVAMTQLFFLGQFQIPNPGPFESAVG